MCSSPVRKKLVYESNGGDWPITGDTSHGAPQRRLPTPHLLTGAGWFASQTGASKGRKECIEEVVS